MSESNERKRRQYPAPGSEVSRGRDSPRQRIRLGCQKKIAEQIVTDGGDFVIAVKDNQRKLYQAIVAVFADHLQRDLEELPYREDQTEDVGHGRIDERADSLTRLPKDFALKTEWPWIKAIGETIRYTVNEYGRETHDVRYDMLSRPQDRSEA